MRCHLLSVGTSCSLILLAGLTLLPAAPLPRKDPDRKEPEPKVEPRGFQPLEVNGDLTLNDPNDPRFNHPGKQFTVTLEKGKTYVIDLVSTDFDTYLRLLDKNGQQLAEDDDSGGNLNARIMYRSNDGGEHKIVATTFSGEVGRFNLKVREAK